MDKKGSNLHSIQVVQESCIDEMEDLFPKKENVKSNEVYYKIINLAENKCYSDLTSRFPYRSSRGNTYVMVVYHFDGNAILIQAIKNREADSISTAWENCFTKIKTNNIRCGIAIKPASPWEEIKPYLNNIDQIIIMTVEPGFGGQKFMDDQLLKINQLRKYISDNQLHVDLEVDGGVNYETGKKCVDAGANILVAGSFLFKQENLTQASNQLYDFFN